MPTQDPLNEQEIAEVQRLFGAPFFIPSAFKSWMADQLALNIPDLPLGSLFGGRGITRSLLATTAGSASSANGTVATIMPVTIQGGSLGANGHLRFMLDCRLVIASGSNSLRAELNFGGTVLCGVEDTGGLTNRTWIIEGEIYNANDPRVQYGGLIRLRLTDGTTVLNTNVWSENGESTVDTTVDQLLKLSVFWGGINANDHLTVNYANVDVVNPAPLGATL